MIADKGIYMAFTPDTTEEKVIRAYIARYGQEPERVFVMYPTRMICAGPVPQPDVLYNWPYHTDGLAGKL